MVIETRTPIAEVAWDLGIHDGTLGDWVNAYRLAHPEPDQPSNLTERACVKEHESGFRKGGSGLRSDARVAEHCSVIEEERANCPITWTRRLLGPVADLMPELAAGRPHASPRTTLPGNQPVTGPDLIAGEFEADGSFIAASKIEIYYRDSFPTRARVVVADHSSDPAETGAAPNRGCSITATAALRFGDRTPVDAPTNRCSLAA